MFEHQSENGAFVSHGEVEIPHITTDFELSLQAARAIAVAPNWLSDLKDEGLVNRVAKLKTWLQDSKPKNDFDRVLRLQLAYYMPELVPQLERDAAIALLSSKQHADGGWSARDMSAVDNWHFEMSPYVLNLISSLPDAAMPESDAYMTALAIVLMRQSHIPATDPRIARGLAWLKREQRESGRWWMHSLYRGNFHYITYIATVEAMKAFDLCGELTGANADTKSTSKWNFTPDPSLPNVLILGDSISVGYTLQVRELLEGKANVLRPMNGQKVVNCSGTTLGVARLDDWLSKEKWSVIHFNWGLHDLKHVETPGSSRKSNDPNSPSQATLEVYARNLEEITAKLKATKARLIFATTTPVAPGTLNPLREPEAPVRYNTAALEIMKHHGIRVNDLFSHCEPHLGEWQLPQNVHFKPVGYAGLAKQVATAIVEELAHVRD
jgi:GDSL-like Lipase/Acylhydrolase family